MQLKVERQHTFELSLYSIWIFVHFGTTYAPYVYGMKYAHGIIIIIIAQKNNIRHSSLISPCT